MTTNERWLKVLKQANVAITESLSTGEIVSVKVRESTNVWRLCLKFTRFLNWSELNNMMEAVRKQFIEESQVTDVKYTVEYVDLGPCAAKDLEEYYRNALLVCGAARKSVIILSNYAYRFLPQGIIIEVPTIDEKKLVDESIVLIKKFFLNYGLKNIAFIVEINDSNVSIKDIHRQQQEVKELQYASKAREEYTKRQARNRSETEQGGFKQLYRNQLIALAICDIPTTSIGVEEFKQQNNTIKVTIAGCIVKAETRLIRTKDGREFHIFQGIVTDYTDSIMIKRFYRNNDAELFEKLIKPNLHITVDGSMQWDDFAKDVVIMCDTVSVGGEDASRKLFDEAEHKRVELHAHTKMSVLDSILDIDEYVGAAKRYGHTALAVTDHANCHILPEFFALAAKAGLKPIAGVEAYYVDDSDFKIALTAQEDIPLSDATFVVFDIETTGLFIPFHEIIEIGAVKIKNGFILETFAEFVKPKRPISDFITNFTEISNDTVYDALPLEEILPRFVEFIDGCILVAHNANFDTDFIYENMKQQGLFVHQYPCIDTLQLARAMYQDGLKHYNLKAVAKYLKVEIEQQHRAIHDARTTTNVFLKMLGDLSDRQISNYAQINTLIHNDELYKYVFPTHLTMLVKNQIGLKNFYKILSDAHTTHFQREARVLKSVLETHREGLLIGSGCVNGDVFRAALEKSYDRLLQKIAFYDYIEVQPPCCYRFLFEKSGETDADDLIQKTIALVIQAAHEMGKPVVATGDVHHLIKADAKYRSIYLSVARPNGGGPHELADYQPMDMHFRTTTEMLDEFSFLPNHVAYEIVVTNSNLIADQIESFNLFPSELYVPRDDFMAKYGVPSMMNAVRDISYQTVHEMYGETLPIYVQERLDKELNAIIGHGFSSVYYISHLLVKNSNDAGYIVGSRGSVGSSFVATMMNITEVNPLKPHYLCPNCHFSAFKFNDKEKAQYHISYLPEVDTLLQQVQVGMDLPQIDCPYCKTPLRREGVDIAFETFLGFEGEKVPDIDLNFSGEYQASAHNFCQEMFGVDGAFRAGTITTVMDKTAFSYVRDFYSKKGIPVRQSEMERLATFLAGSKKTTGQHPGGIVVVPDTIEYTDIIPVQYPPVGDVDQIGDLKWRTSHYDYHSFEKQLLKLDILGHDDPTVIKTLMDYVHKEPEKFPFDTVDGIPYIDDQVIAIFRTKDALGMNGDDNDTLLSGTIGIPEFGTSFVRGMLATIQPKTYNDIIKVSGLSHGTDVWMKNAEDLFKGVIPGYPAVPFSEVIGCRDDIMIYLLNKELPAHEAFMIMESVRKGKGLTKEDEALMRKHHVPEWYIYSCNKIKYMFPKAHATAYVIMALRIGWFKVHRPIYYYAAYFSKRAKEFDAEVFAMGKNAIRNKIAEIDEKIKNRTATNKELGLVGELRIALEMVLRGLSFRQIDIQKSLARDFVISEDGKALYLPFVTIESLGDAVAYSIVEAREKYPFTSKKDVESRTSINKTQYAKLKTLGVFDVLPDDDTLV